MRLPIILFAALTCAAPAAAQPVFDETMDEEIARAIPHPFDVEIAGDRLGRAVGAMLDVPVGGVARAVDPFSNVPPDATVGEIAGAGDPYFRGRVEDEVGRLTLGAADMMRVLATVTPALRRSLADLERNLDAAIGGPGYDPYE